jgi:transcriptional regulator with XRE-family HTH domain
MAIRETYNFDAASESRFSECFKIARKEAGISQRELAKRSGISYSYITKLKTGEADNPTRNVLNCLGKVLDSPANVVSNFDFDYEFGGLVREERKEQGTTMKELAAELGVTEMAVSSWERGKNRTTYNNAVKLAAALGYTVPALLDKYGHYDDYIPAHFNGDVNAWEAFKKARDEGALKEIADSGLTVLQKSNIEKIKNLNHQNNIQAAGYLDSLLSAERSAASSNIAFPNTETLGPYIYNARVALGLTQKELAKQAGLSRNMINQYELGKALPRIEQYRAVIRALSAGQKQQEVQKQ